MSQTSVARGGKPGNISVGNNVSWSFHVVVLQRILKKYIRIYNARAQPHSSLNRLCGGVLITVVVVASLQLPVNNKNTFLPCGLFNTIANVSFLNGCFEKQCRVDRISYSIFVGFSVLDGIFHYWNVYFT